MKSSNSPHDNYHCLHHQLLVLPYR